jgi:uncharacterized protein (TIGR02145 family)
MHAQVPTLIPHQGVARNGAGEPLSNVNLTARFTIRHETADGTVVWQEQQSLQTNSLGLFTAQLGSVVSLADVNWSNGEKLLQVELDLGSGFVDIGTQQLLSVPYALHARSVDLQVSPIGDTLFVGDGSFVIVPGISQANSNNSGGGGSGGGTTTGNTLHSCGAPNVHNPNLGNGSMTDQEGNVYKTIVIGTQEWMAENLNTSIYRNGDLIAAVLNNAAWSSTNTGAWSYYNNDESYECPYGKLYNWFACIDSRELCPVGWHVPSDGEWIVLENYLGGATTASGKVRSLGYVSDGSGFWPNSDVLVTNESGFSALPGGLRGSTGNFGSLSGAAYLWTSTDGGNNGPWFRRVIFDSFAIQRFDGYYVDGFSVRCLRD